MCLLQIHPNRAVIRRAAFGVTFLDLKLAIKQLDLVTDFQIVLLLQLLADNQRAFGDLIEERFLGIAVSDRDFTPSTDDDNRMIDFLIPIHFRGNHRQQRRAACGVFRR